jgi:hypothetical protein
MHVCVCLCVCVRVCVQFTYIYMHICIYICMYMYVYIYMCIHIYIYTYIHTYIHTSLHRTHLEYAHVLARLRRSISPRIRCDPHLKISPPHSERDPPTPPPATRLFPRCPQGTSVKLIEAIGRPNDATFRIYILYIIFTYTYNIYIYIYYIYI